MEFTKNHLNYTILLLLVMLFSRTATADRPEFEIGGGVIKFKYTEFNDSGVFLDGETGLIPGVVLKGRFSNTKGFVDIVGNLHGNTIKYDGQTQGGTPLQTKSDAFILDHYVKLGVHTNTARNNSPYIGLGFRYWLRNIRPGYDVNGNSVAGILEHYYWNYLLVGYEGRFSITDNVKIGFDLGYTLMLNGKMDVNFLGYKNYDNAQVNLGNESGGRLSIPIEIKMRRSSLIVTPYYERINIGKSNTVRVTSGGVATATSIYEPRSETRNMGINITWLW